MTKSENPHKRTVRSKVIRTTCFTWAILFVLVLISLPFQMIILWGSFMADYGDAFGNGTRSRSTSEPNLIGSVLDHGFDLIKLPFLIIDHFKLSSWMLPVIWIIGLFPIALLIALLRNRKILFSRRRHWT